MDDLGILWYGSRALLGGYLILENGTCGGALDGHSGGNILRYHDTQFVHICGASFLLCQCLRSWYHVQLHGTAGTPMMLQLDA